MVRNELIKAIGFVVVGSWMTFIEFGFGFGFEQKSFAQETRTEEICFHNLIKNLLNA